MTADFQPGDVECPICQRTPCEAGPMPNTILPELPPGVFASIVRRDRIMDANWRHHVATLTTRSAAWIAAAEAVIAAAEEHRTMSGPEMGCPSRSRKNIAESLAILRKIEATQ